MARTLSTYLIKKTSRFLYNKEDRRECHNGRSDHKRICHDSIRRIVVMRSWDQFAYSTYDHHSCNEGKHDTINGMREVISQTGPTQEGSKRFSHSGKQGPREGLPAMPRGVVDWHGDTQSFRDVVESNGNRQDGPNAWIAQCGNKRGESLGKVVNANGQDRVEAP